MKSTLHVVFDLGSDSLKTVYGYEDGSGNGRYGVLDTKDELKVGIPAVALFKKKTGVWLFGYEVSESGETDFTTLVQIKDLIWLLESANESDKQYYSSRHMFPEYDLPDERKKYKSMADVERAGKAFDGQKTPRELCMDFFRYAKRVIDADVKSLCDFHTSAYGVDFKSTYSCSITFPTGKKSFSRELELIISSVFGKVKKNLNSVKAFGLYAQENSLIDDNERFLIFDIGEKQISVAKAWTSGGQPNVEGVEGHNLPEEIGGITIDEAIRKGIENSLLRRETLATPSFGKPGHVTEVCIDSKKYQLLQDIKAAKHMLCSPHADEDFPNGVPLYIAYECFVRYELTPASMNGYICDTPGNTDSAFKQIARYVVSEAKRGINRDVRKIFLAGGVANTKGLREYIQTELLTSGCYITPTTLDGNSRWRSGSVFSVPADERNIYACALGTAIAAVKKIDIKTMLSLSYGTWGVFKKKTSGNGLQLSLFAKKGAILNPNEPTVLMTEGYFTYNFTESDPFVCIANDAIISTHASEEELRRDAKISTTSDRFYFREPTDPRLILIETSTPTSSDTLAKRLKESFKRPTAVMEYYGLRPKMFSDIIAYYNGEAVALKPDTSGSMGTLCFHEGIIANPDGKAQITFKNVSNGSAYVFAIPIKYNPAYGGSIEKMRCGAAKFIKLKDVELRPYDSVEMSVESN